MFLKNKKGNLFGIIVILIFIMVVSTVVIYSKYLTGQFYDKMNDIVEETDEMQTAESSMRQNFLNFDYAIVIMTVILFIGLIVTSFMIPTHPVFFVINFIGMFVLVYFGMLLNNVFGEIMTGGDALLYSTAMEFPKMTFLISYLPYVAAILVFVLTIVMFSRGQSNASGY